MHRERSFICKEVTNVTSLLPSLTTLPRILFNPYSYMIVFGHIQSDMIIYDLITRHAPS